LPAATVISNAAICTGSSISIGASSVSGNTYSWTSSPSGFTSTNANPSVNPSATTTYTLVETVTATGCNKSNPVTITVNPLPTASVISNTSICNGNSVAIGAASVTGSTYSWTSSPTGFTSTSSNPTVNPDSTTNYKLVETITSTGCFKADSITIIVNPIPKAVVGPSETICPGNGLTIGDLPVPGNTYLWSSVPAGFTSTISSPSLLPTNSAKYVLTETISSTGCSKTDTTQIIIDPNCKGYLSLEMDTTMNTFDTLTVKVNVRNAKNLYSLYARLEMKPDVFKLMSAIPGNILGTSIVNTPAIKNKGFIEFGISKSGLKSGVYGNGLFYTFSIIIKDTVPILDVKSLFSLDSITAYDSIGSRINVYDSSGKTITVHYNVPANVNVWPGDLNNDKVVNVSDILPIGYYYNITGNKRPSANLSWTAQSSPFWNYDKTHRSKRGLAVYADADGNGVINLADLAAIGLNMAKTHTKQTIFQYPNLPANKAGDPDLTASFPDTFILKTTLPKTVTIPINLGSSSIPFKKLNGVAFNLFFNPKYVDPSSVSLDYSNTIFGTENADYIKQEDMDLPNGRIGIGLTRFNDASLNGHGNIVNLTFTVLASAPDGYFKLSVIVLQAADSNGNNISINSNADSTRIGKKSGIEPVATNYLNSLNIYPNPFQGSTNLQYSLCCEAMVNITLYDLSGKQIGLVLNENQMPGNYNFDINAEKYHLQPGMYLLKIMMDDQVISRHIVKL